MTGLALTPACKRCGEHTPVLLSRRHADGARGDSQSWSDVANAGLV